MYSEAIIWWLFLITSLLWGAVAGSFSTMLIYRLPRNLPLWKFKHQDCNYNYSCCPHCLHRLGAKDLIPILSWLMLSGRCRYCKNKIPIRYMLIELLSVLICYIIYLVVGPCLAVIPLLISVPILISLLMIDLDFQILPDLLNALAFILGIIFIILDNESILWALVASASYVVFALIVRFGVSLALKKEAMGLGDVKFFAVAGLWLGLSLLPHFLLISGILGVIFGLLYRKNKKTKRFPFGPCLIVAMILCFVCGELIFL